MRRTHSYLFFSLPLTALVAIGLLGNSLADGRFADPIEVHISPNHASIAVSGLTRGGASFPLIPAENGFTSHSWTREIVLTPKGPHSLIQTVVTVQSGATRYEGKIDELTLSEESVRIGRTTLGLPPVGIPVFTHIINWPGIDQVLFRYLKTFGPYLLFTFCLGSLGAILYVRQMEKNHYQPTPSVSREQVWLTAVFCSVLLCAFAYLDFRAVLPTAAEWPAFDLAPTLARLNDPSFLPQDFFTNASSLPNPRLVFASLVILIERSFNLDWYGAMFLLKVLFVFSMPLLFFFTLFGAARHSLSRYQQVWFMIAAATGVAVCFLPLVTDQFVIALWFPYQTMANAHTASLATALLASILTNTGHFKKSYAAWSIATLLHPSISLSTFMFHLVISPLQSKQQIVTNIGSIVTSALFIQWYFRVAEPLPAAEFINHYIVSNHSFHYLIRSFETSPMAIFPWYINFTTIVTLLFGSYLLAHTRKLPHLKTTSLFAIITLIGALSVNYVGIEVYPTKSLAALGPSRYTLFGFWFLVFAASYLFATMPARFYPRLPFTFPSLSPWTGFFVMAIILTALVTSSFFLHKDDPFGAWRNQNADFATWVATTPKDAVFATNVFDHNIYLPLAAERAIFTGNGFPFREDQFTEFNARRSQLYGTPTDWSTMEGASDTIKMSQYYRNLTPADFVAISNRYPLQYVIIERNWDQEFLDFASVFSDETIAVYDINSLKPSL